MILKGAQRGGARDLALHLMRMDENEHVEVHRLRGFASEDLMGALNEMYAVSRGTQCRQFMYSVIFNPPPNEAVNTADFEAAIERVEKKFKLSDQPCAVVFHEKEGRRHAHAVWSRIDTDQMKAIQLSYFKNKLQTISRELFLEHGWTMPKGLIKSKERDPKNFTLDEWQHAKRIGKDPREIKTDIQDAWAISDSKVAFMHALEERGYRLALGDSARFAAVDHNGEAFSVVRSLPKGVKTKDVRARLGNEADLPSVGETKKQIADDMLSAMHRHKAELDRQKDAARIEFERRRSALVQRQRSERRNLRETQVQRQVEESLSRQLRFRKGLKGLWDRVRGEHRRIREQNEREAAASIIRGEKEKEALIQAQLGQRQRLKEISRLFRQVQTDQKHEIEQDVQRYSEMQQSTAHEDTTKRPRTERRQISRRRSHRRGPDYEIEM